MEPASLALAVFSTLKEVYLLSKFVLRIISSALKHQNERTRLHLQFRHELLFLKSFGYLLVRDDNTVLYDNELDADWLAHIGHILEQLRAAYGDYSKLAAAKDDEYKRYSPYSPSTVPGSRTIEFSLLIEEAPVELSATEEHKQSTSWLSNYSRKLTNMDWRWALFQKGKLEEVLADLKIWNGMLKELVPIKLAAGMPANTQSFSLPLTAQASKEDMARLGITTHSQLRKVNVDDYTEDLDVLLRDVSLETLEAAPPTLLSSGVLTRDPGLRVNVLIEYKPFIQRQKDISSKKSVSNPRSSHMEDGAMRLANLLRLAGKSELRTLPFVGYFEQNSLQPPRYAFLFKYPDNALETSPVALDEIIASATHDISLQDRFAIARRVATSLWTFHTDGWVHKCVRSQSIVFFRGHCGTIIYQDPFLVNFEYSRPAGQNTSFTWDEDDEKNLYRHPERQGPPMKSFDKTHDSYALGVVLLEIGIWRRAIEIREAARKAQRPSARFDRYDLKNAFITSAKEHLPRLMGSAYRDAVLTCLGGNFSNKVHDAGFGMEFYRKVVQNLDVKRLLVTV